MILYPKAYFNMTKEISIEFLEENNIKGLILDVDNTLIDYYKNMPRGTLEWSNLLKEKGIKLCILSNSNKIDKVKEIAAKLDIPYIHFAKKPLKVGFLKAKEILGLETINIGVVGDQLFTDILGANRCKMFSILVEPIHERDIFITVIKRPIEKLIKKGYLKKHIRKEED